MELDQQIQVFFKSSSLQVSTDNKCSVSVMYTSTVRVHTYIIICTVKLAVMELSLQSDNGDILLCLQIMELSHANIATPKNYQRKPLYFYTNPYNRDGKNSELGC